MNILTKYTKTSLAKNKTRTTVTIIGIMLAVAMFTAVTEAIVSAQQFLISYIEKTSGSYHAYASELESDEVSALTKERQVKEYVSLDNIGYADIGSENAYKPYLYIASMSEGFTDLVAVNLRSGRLPVNSDEIILPYHLFENGNVSFSLGDTLNLQVGTRHFEGFDLYQSSPFEENENLINTQPQTYTVVGFYERFDYTVERYESPGYTALTVGKRGVNTDLFFKFRSVLNARETVNELFEKYPTITSNSDLLRMHGSFGSSAIMSMVGGFAAILIGLIMFGSVSLIYNSFSISVSERTKQFGMLKSIGATKAQIRSTVIKEALMLCLAGVPLGLITGCVGIGITLYCISDKLSLMLTKLYSGATALDTRISLHLSPTALIAAAVIGVVTALISAYIPARKAVKITPIEAVRQSRDVKVKRSRRPEKYRLTQKLFGFEGMIAAKNFARYKRRYRAAVMSMFMSVVLFISASSFCDYLTNAVDIVSDDVGYDIRASISWNSEQDAEFLLELQSSESAAYCATDSIDVYIGDDMLDSDYIKAFTGKFVHGVNIVFVDDANYQKLVKDNKLRENGGAIILNQYRHYDENSKVTVYPVVNEKKVKDSVRVSLPKKLDGYYYSYFDGTFFNYFEITDSKIQNQKELPFEQALEEYSITISGFIDERPYFVEDSGLVAIYPVSVMPEGNEISKAFFITDDYAACQKELDEELTNRSMGYSIYNNAETNATNRAMAVVINVFAYGFIILISLIALANVFNTVTTNIYLRRRELAMIKAVGITNGGFNKMMNYECVICGIRSLAYGLPASVAVTYLIYLAANSGFGTDFYMPWYSVTVAVLSVFVVVFVSMLYSMNKLRKENIIETLRNENI